MHCLGLNVLLAMLAQLLFCALVPPLVQAAATAQSLANPTAEAIEKSLYHDPQKALTTAETALKELALTNADRARWEVIASEAAIVLELSEPALRHAQSGLALVTESGIKTEVGQRLLISLAITQRRTGRLQESIKTINGVVATLEAGNLPSWLMVDALTERANMFSDLGNFRSALSDLLRAYALADPQATNGRRGDVAGYLGIVYVGMRDYVHAAQYHREALESAIQHGELVTQSIEEYSLARALQLSEKYSEAEQYYKSSREHSVQIDDAQGVAFADVGLAELALVEKNFTLAEQRYRSALPVVIEAKNIKLQGAIARGLGTLALSRQQFKQAFEQAKIALQMSQSEHALDQEIAAHDLLSQIHFANGDFRLAYEHGATARQMEKTQLVAARDLSVAGMEERFIGERQKQENDALKQKNEFNEHQLIEQKRNTRIYYVVSAFLLLLVGFLIYSAYKNRQLRDKLSKLALTDTLTGIANRGSALALFEQEFIRARRYDFPLSIAMIDLDHFKSINDNFGHDAGDEVLREFCQMVRTHLRLTDSFGRWGGEEFIIILPHIGPEDAISLIERIREAMSDLPCKKLCGERRPTFSAGLAFQMLEDTNIDEPIKRADAALYAAKNNGRNCLKVG